MNIVLINGSPKTSNNNSAYFLSELKKLIETNNKIEEFKISKNSNYTEVLESIRNCDKLIFAFPLYVDGLPSHLIQFLEEAEKFLNINMEADIRKAISVYSMVNCGFYEGKQTHLAIKMIEHWCKKTNLTYCQGIGIGTGEMLGSLDSVPIGHGPKKNLGNALKDLSNNILNNSTGNTIFISANFPRFAFKYMAHSGWRASAKSNGLTKADILKK